MSGQNVSHHFNRYFKIDKVTEPRGFNASDWAWFTSHGNYVLEIGAGRGKHAMDYAVAHPDETVIAIERTHNKFKSFYQNFLHGKNMGKYANLYPIHADAIAWTTHALPKNSLSKIFLLYPNPEYNNINQQWLNMPFFEFLLSRLQSKGQIILSSNISSYIDNVVNQAINTWRLPYVLENIQNHQNNGRTHFEIKYLARGETCQQVIITKPQGYVTRFDE